MLPQQGIMVKENVRIDAHAHVFAASGAIALDARYLPAGEAPVAQWLARQDEAARSVVLRDTPAELFRFCCLAPCDSGGIAPRPLCRNG